MKVYTPEISWHNREAVLSVDIRCHEEKTKDGFLQYRIASGSMDNHVIIWRAAVKRFAAGAQGDVGIIAVADLNRHIKPINVVRFSPSGVLLASGDNEGVIVVWKFTNVPVEELKKKTNGVEEGLDDYGIVNEEQWVQTKMLRGHLGDVNDLCWSEDSMFLISGSVDNSAYLWDVTKGQKLDHFRHEGTFVQGVAFDPLAQYFATLSSDRCLRLFNASTKKLIYKTHKAVFKEKSTKIFYDDTIPSFFRRISFSAGGEFLIASSGIIELEKENDDEIKFINCVHLFLRSSLNKPFACYPTGSKYNVAVSCCPTPFILRPNYKNPFPFEYRIVFAVATKDSILFYDTQHESPFALISDIHYTSLSDLKWSEDGRLLMVSSTDGYCTFVTFSEHELGELYVGELYKNEFTIPLSESPKTKVVTDQVPVKVEKSPDTVSKKTPESTSAKITQFFTKVPKGEQAELLGTPVLSCKRKMSDSFDVNAKAKVAENGVKVMEVSSVSATNPAKVTSFNGCVPLAIESAEKAETKPKPAVVAKKPRRVQLITLNTPR